MRIGRWGILTNVARLLLCYTVGASQLPHSIADTRRACAQDLGHNCEAVVVRSAECGVRSRVARRDRRGEGA